MNRLPYRVGHSARSTSATLLSCGHTVAFPDPAPEPKTVAHCFRCADYRRVVRVGTQWIIRCETCGRGHGRVMRTEAQARKEAASHVTRLPTHEVKLYADGELVESVTMTDQALPLQIDDLGAPIPF